MKHLKLLSIAAIACVIGLAAAQSPSNQGEPPAFFPPDPGLIKLDFPGGTAQQYVDAIRAASADANIVVIGDLAAITMPAIKLRNVDTWAAVRILNSLPQQQKDLLTVVEAQITSNEPDQSRVYTVSAQVTRMGSLGAAVESTVISVADVLQGEIKAEDLLTAVEIAMDVVGKADEPAEIKFHKETGLLIARGSGDQIQAIHKVIEQLREQMHLAHPNDDAALVWQREMNVKQLDLDNTRRALEDREMKLRALQDRIIELEAKLSRLTPQ